MKNDKKNASLTTLTLLAHTQLASSPWGKSKIDYLLTHANNQKITIKIIYDWQSASQLKPNSILIVFGTDSIWIDEVSKNLAPLHFRIIFLDIQIKSGFEHINNILFDQFFFVEQSLRLLKAHGRSRTAFLGIQQNDLSDLSKASTFTQYASVTDVYSFTNNIDSCFNEFLKRIDHYDSVICANDLTAVYLIKRCLEHNIIIPQQLFVIGNGNLWISAHITPSLTTWSYDRDSMANMILQICKNLSVSSQTGTMDIIIRPNISERMTTEKLSDLTYDKNKYPKKYVPDNTTFSNTDYKQCPEIQKIQVLDLQLSSFSPDDLLILQRLTDGNSYEAISEELFMALDTIKYRIKKLYRYLGIHTRQELIELASEYHIRFA